MPGTPKVAPRAALWTEILRISVEVEGATRFTIDSTTAAGRSQAEDLEDRASLNAVGVDPDVRQPALRPIHGLWEALADVGPRVLSVDLYADREWIAGISDWGDEFDVLFGDTAWSALSSAVKRLCPSAIVDQAEARSRPTFDGDAGHARPGTGAG
jgi:hypothetical protein